jgi:hypothetical protein
MNTTKAYATRSMVIGESAEHIAHAAFGWREGELERELIARTSQRSGKVW